jgi:peptidoglycan/xylan/chitin deacetylase (PgdA/CDA1 family)
MGLRFDRLATLYLFHPLRRGTWTGPSVPILMYHSVSNDSGPRVHPYYQTVTSPLAFKSQMQQLKDTGYKTVSLREAVNVLRKQESIAKQAVITFDDGFADFYREAFPELSRHGFTATMFLPTAYIGTSRLQFKQKDCLTWSEICELRNHGISFGSHTVSHPQLSMLSPSAVEVEVTKSKHTIEEKLGEPIESFAYPFAFPETNKPFVQMLRSILLKSGYLNGVSTCIGTARSQEDPYFLRRLPINSLDDRSLFSAKLLGGYDWLHKFQVAAKRVRARA